MGEVSFDIGRGENKMNEWLQAIFLFFGALLGFLLLMIIIAMFWDLIVANANGK